mgnify:CR=1 FL=1
MDQTRYVIKEVQWCAQCDYFWGEGEFCKHPDHKRTTMVVSDGDLKARRIPGFCPLPSCEDNKGGDNA